MQQVCLVQKAETAAGCAGLQTTPIGVGAWSWGDRSGYWGYGGDYNKDTNQEAFKALVDSKIGLIDTAEVGADAKEFRPKFEW